MKEEDNGIFFFSSRRKNKKHREKKNVKKGGSLPSLAFAFGMKLSSCLLLSTFLQS
jgi:hypothetical protein